MRVLVTGARGFIGSEVCQVLVGQGESVRALVRTVPDAASTDIDYRIADLGETRLDPLIFTDVDCVVHLAGRAHVLNDQLDDPLSAFRKQNRDVTLALAEQALASGVKRFVFVSSIGVNGAETPDTAFTESSPSAPHADYALSKHEAEILLRERLAGAEMELVIIRPPMVYGLNAPGNFGRLLKWVAAGVPLPFGRVKNQRSLISLTNLARFIFLCVSHPAAAGHVFLISDGADVSTAQMVKALADGMNSRSALLPVPVFLMRWGAIILKKESMYKQLCGSLRIDISKAQTLLGWVPASTFDGLREVGRLHSLQKKTRPNR